MKMDTYEDMFEYCKRICKINDWILNEDKEILKDLIKGLVDNKTRYTYQSCPCRLASGLRSIDRDIICPCDYAPPDIIEYGSCYCNLFMHLNFYENGITFVKVPERRPIEKEKVVLNHIRSKK